MWPNSPHNPFMCRVSKEKHRSVNSVESPHMVVFQWGRLGHESGELRWLMSWLVSFSLLARIPLLPVLNNECPVELRPFLKMGRVTTWSVSQLSSPPLHTPLISTRYRSPLSPMGEIAPSFPHHLSLNIIFAARSVPRYQYTNVMMTVLMFWTASGQKENHSPGTTHSWISSSSLLRHCSLEGDLWDRNNTDPPFKIQ